MTPDHHAAVRQLREALKHADITLQSLAQSSPAAARHCEHARFLLGCVAFEAKVAILAAEHRAASAATDAAMLSPTDANKAAKMQWDSGNGT